MIKRILTAGICISLLIAIFLISPIWKELPAFFLVIIVGFVLNFELMNLVKEKKGIRYPFFLIGVLTSLSTLFFYLFGMKIIDFSTLIVSQSVFFLVFFYYSVSREILKAYDYSKNFENIGFYLIVYITLILLYPQFLLIKFVQPNSWAIVLLFGFCWLSDAFGLFTGMAFGKHKLEMLPSKSKTLEGYIGSLILTTLLGVLLYHLQGVLYLPFQWSLLKWTLFGFSMSFGSNFGDLAESLIKRWADKKDSGTSLPGMGGFFDAIDSPIYSIPIALLFFSF